uniref:Meiosis-specific nuclear structural protein 1 n=1 Tax=Mesocestoides corti TaxID=53468 RepID=A0A5K3FYW9_MESCO
MISAKGKRDQSVHRKEILRSKIREIQRLRELERQHMAETGYRKRIGESRDLYRPMLNELYLRDLDAQVELNKRIQAYRDQKEASLEKSDSGLPGLGWETTREVKSAMCAREARILAVAEEKMKESEDMQRLEQARLADEQKAAEVALSRRKMLQCCFEQQIQEKCRAIQKRAMEEAVASKWLISNDTQLGLQMDEAFRRHKVGDALLVCLTTLN